MRRLVAWLLRPPCFGGLIGSMVFLWLSLTPSLVPRSWPVQAVLAGLTASIGYGFGSASSALTRRFLLRAEPSARARRVAWRVLAVVALAATLLVVNMGARWDDEVRRLMGMPTEAAWHHAAMLLTTVVVAVLLVTIGRLVRGLGRLIAQLVGRVLPRPLAVTIAVVGTVAVLVFVVTGNLLRAVYTAIDSGAALADQTFDPDIDQPTSPNRSGSDASLVDWETLGAKGREFTGRGPTVSELSAFAGRSAMDPIRLYAGMRTVPSIEERVAVLMAEMDRTAGWDRAAIIIQTPSGNGEIPRFNADAPEYLMAGDLAQVVLQYSYAPSFTTMVSNPGVGEAAGRALVDAIIERVAALPRSERPAVFVAGESLGSLATEAAFGDVDDLTARVDGALFVGPTLFNDLRNDLTASRDPGSPVWLPVIDDGATVRFALRPSHLMEPDSPWDGSRVVYLQNSSDPVAWFSPRLLYRSPDFLDDPRGPDVSPRMTWIPVVTFWQTVLDLPFASRTPPGHGHRYGLNVVDGWAAVLDPPDWSSGDTERLRDELAS